MTDPQRFSTGLTGRADSSPTLELKEESFRFVQALAAELSQGRVDLPSFPDVAMRVRKALNDDDVTVEQIARIVGSEAALAATIFTMANSPVMGLGQQPVHDLKGAIARIGLSNVRAAALAFSLGQLRKAVQFQSIRDDLNRLWHDSTAVAALARVLAMRVPDVNADYALLAGLLHNIGSVYVVARIQRLPALANRPDTVRDILRDWTPGIGRSIAENWGMPEEVFEAIGDQSAAEPARRGASRTADILSLAILATAAMQDPSGEPASGRLPAACQRLGLTEAQWHDIVGTTTKDVAALRAVLSG